MTLAIAHRGDPLAHTENTIAAILAAARLGADAVEVDVRCTADGVAVVHHDQTLARLWSHGGALHRMTWEQVRRHAPEVPTLQEALSAMRAHDVPLLLDVDSIPAAREAYRVAAAESARGRPRDHAWFCGTLRAMAAIRQTDPSATVMLSWKRPVPPDPRALHLTRPTFINPWHGWLTQRAVDDWQARRLKVCTWTVDRVARRRQLIGWGLDAIISNRVPGTVSDCAKRHVTRRGEPASRCAHAEPH